MRLNRLIGIGGWFIFLLIAAVILSNAILLASANPLISKPFNLTQPDGTNFSALEIGDEFVRGYVTVDGEYAITKGSDGFWHYVDSKSGNVSSKVKIENPNSRDQRGLYLNSSKIQLLATGGSPNPQFVKPAGQINYAVILVDFTDSRTKIAPSISKINIHSKTAN